MTDADDKAGWHGVSARQGCGNKGSGETPDENIIKAGREGEQIKRRARGEGERYI